MKCKSLPFTFLLVYSLMITAKPPVYIPEELYDAFSMQGKVLINYLYFDGIAVAPKHFSKELVNDYLRQIREGKTFYYGHTDRWLYQALNKYNIAGKNVVVFGSSKPIYEGICIHYGAFPTTLEYLKWTTNHPALTCITPDEYDQDPILFDIALSISSFEHDGLGRYGDPINPMGDIQAMQKVKKMVKPGGLLFLAVPIGRDRLYWNAHRIYGPHRLPLLLDGWEFVESFGLSGLNDPKINQENLDATYQPILVLKNSQ